MFASLFASLSRRLSQAGIRQRGAVAGLVLTLACSQPALAANGAISKAFWLLFVPLGMPGFLDW